MAEDLKEYNHYKYNESSSENGDGFIEFLFQHTEVEAPEVDENRAWDALNKKIHKPYKGFGWMKVAAAVAILAILSVSLYLYDPTPSQIHVATTDQKMSVTFPDGSIGVLNANSSFTYPEEFGEQRNVSFVGEAYFDIQKSEKPFIIDVNGVNVQVLGTAFNLVTTEKEVKLFVDRGLVAFEKEGQQTKVEAGKEAIFNRLDASVSILAVPSENIMSWRNGIFNFDQTPLSEALVELGEYYDVEFKVANEKLEQCRISATFKNQSLQEVLKTIGAVLNIKATIKGDIVKISGSGC